MQKKKTAAFLGSPICMNGSGTMLLLLGSPFFSSNDDGKLGCSYLVGCLIRQRGARSTRFHGAQIQARWICRRRCFSVLPRDDRQQVPEAGSVPGAAVVPAEEGGLKRERERERNIHLSLEQ